MTGFYGYQDPGVQGLLEFVIAYIDHVPSFLDAVRSIARKASIEAYVSPCLEVAQDFFLKPPELVASHVGLDELMDEVNDRFMAQVGIPLVPMDMTLSNLIAHNLFNKPFANELDEAVHFAEEKVIHKQHVYESEAFKAYIEAHRTNDWKKELAQWPCLGKMRLSPST